MVTQKDIAKEIGLSQATVSLVLQGVTDGVIPGTTIEKVRKAARDLGYRPNRVAQALRTNKTYTLACVVPDITNPYYPFLVRGFQSICDISGFDVIVVNTDGKREKELNFLNLALQGKVDAIFGVFFNLFPIDFEPFIKKGIPAVCLGPSTANYPDGVDHFFVDGSFAANDITNYLISLGHTKISMIAGSGGPQIERVDGYKTAMVEVGLTSSTQLSEEFSEQGGYDATKQLFARGEKPSAILAANDLMAIGCLRALKTLSLCVPHDVAVAGFDDIPASELVTPTLTTVRMHQQNIGAEAAKKILNRLSGSESSLWRTGPFPYEIIQRNST